MMPAPIQPSGVPGVDYDPMSKEARLALVPPGMPDWTAPRGDFVRPDQPPEVQAKLLKAEARMRQMDRHFGPPIKGRGEE